MHFRNDSANNHDIKTCDSRLAPGPGSVLVPIGDHIALPVVRAAGYIQRENASRFGWLWLALVCLHRGSGTDRAAMHS
ncbi:MAG: hypothetical protein ABI575_09370 [Oxalobacteraceae bacterium]